MKKIFYALCAMLIMVSCARTAKEDYTVPRRTVIAGKVLNYNGRTDIDVYVNKPGVNRDHIVSRPDSAGNFHAEFDIYIPTDATIGYITNFRALILPGDSVYLEFDGKKRNRPGLLETITFGGDGAKRNSQAAVFQKMYFANELYTDWDRKQAAVKDYDVEEYKMYLDTLRRKGNELYQKFVDENSPEEIVKIWAKLNIEQDYYDQLSFYPSDHRKANNLKYDDWNVPLGYYDSLLLRLPVSSAEYINGYTLTNFVNRFHYNYVNNNIWAEEENLQYVFPGGGRGGPSDVMDSISVYGIIKHTPDTLLRQMVLAELFIQSLDRQKIDLYENFRDVADKYITEPFLREPLYANYLEVKSRIEAPKLHSDAVLKDVGESLIAEIFNEILTENKGKVIYMDTWATWCGPCMGEMPNSKKLEEEMKGKDVAFVYVNVNDQEKLWKAALAELQLAGQHYFLLPQQSSEMSKMFGIQGIPFYILIDKEGTIIEKGSHLRPGSVKPAIEKLLQK